MILIIKHIECEGPGLIGKFFELFGRDVETIELGRAEELPKDLEKVDAVVVMGGPMNVYEEEKYRFLKKEDDFLKKVIISDIPLLGICLGGQLIAKALGARVKKADSGEIGWGKVTLTEDALCDPLFEGMPREMDVFQWHEDEFAPPEGSVLLAYSDVCPQAFKFGGNVYGLQFHIEVTPEMVEEWFKEYMEESGRRSAGYENMIKRAYEEKDKFSKQAYKLLFNFSNLIKNSCDASVSDVDRENENH